MECQTAQKFQLRWPRSMKAVPSKPSSAAIPSLKPDQKISFGSAIWERAPARPYNDEGAERCCRMTQTVKRNSYSRACAASSAAADGRRDGGLLSSRCLMRVLTFAMMRDPAFEQRTASTWSRGLRVRSSTAWRSSSLSLAVRSAPSSAMISLSSRARSTAFRV